jgi:hypothetical protein
MAFTPLCKPFKSYNVAVGATSAASAATTPTIDTIRLVSTTNCWVKLGVTPTADKTTSVYLPAGVVEYFRVGASGAEAVAVIEDTATGTLVVTEMTQ